MTNITYNGLDLGNVQNIKENNNAGLVDFPLPGGSAGTAIIFDMGGVTKDFELTTKFIGTETQVTNVLGSMTEYCNGRQGTVRSLALPFGRTCNCVIKRWDWSTDSQQGANDTGSNLMIDLRIDLANGDIQSIWD